MVSETTRLAGYCFASNCRARLISKQAKLLPSQDFNSVANASPCLLMASAARV
jgi:hypothetical protein